MNNKFKWIFKSGWAILDQTLYNGVNFLVNILLARWLIAEDYGAFAFSYSIFLIILYLQSAVITEPFLIQGSGRFSNKIQNYFKKVLQGHFIFTGVFSFLGIISLFIFYFDINNYSKDALFGAFLAAPFILYLFFLRKAFYLKSLPKVPAIAGLFYLILNVSMFFIGYHYQFLTSLNAYLILAITSLVVGIFLTKIFIVKHQSSNELISTKLIFSEHWIYGKWAGPTMLLKWFPINFYFLILPITAFGLEGAANLKAVMNIILPILHVIFAISTITLPLFSKYVHNSDIINFKRVFKYSLGAFLALTIIYLIAVNFFGSQIYTVLYGGQYEYIYIYILLGSLYPIFSSLSAVLGNILRASGLQNVIFWASLASTVSTLLLGTILTFKLGIFGALIAMIISMLISVIIMGSYYRRVNLKINC